jgi:hypothetical protein
MLEGLSLSLAQRLPRKRAFPPKSRTRRVKERERAAATPLAITVPPLTHLNSMLLRVYCTKTEKSIWSSTPNIRMGALDKSSMMFKVDAKGTRLADKHLCPIRNMVPPTDISELRRTLGLFVVSRKYLRDYAQITKPLTDLLRGKQPVFKWDLPQQQAYEYVRDALLAGIHLSAPNFSLPFHLQTDASEDGKGGTLYQLLLCPIAEQYPYCKDKHAPDMMSIIAFFSKAWTEAQRLRPPFYLEADSLLWCTNEAKFYALSSPFPLYTYSDHMPLSWMKKSEKGPVS